MTSVAKSEAVATSSYNERRSRHQSAFATSLAKERRSRHHSMVATSVALKGGRDIIKRSQQQKRRLEVATSFSCRDISCTERRSRNHSVVATSFSCLDNSCIERRSRHHLAVATSVQRDLGSRHHLAVATSNPRDANYKSRPHKSLCDVAETTEVVTTNRGRDINNKMGQLT